MLTDLLCEERNHHLDTLVCPLLIVVLGAANRVKQPVSVLWDPYETNSNIGNVCICLSKQKQRGYQTLQGYIDIMHSTKKPVTTMLTYPWKCTVLHYNHLGNTWKPLVLMTRHFDYCPSASEGDNQSVRSSAPVVSRCFPGGYNVKLYISRGRLAWWLPAFLHSDACPIRL